MTTPLGSIPIKDNTDRRVVDGWLELKTAVEHMNRACDAFVFAVSTQMSEKQIANQSFEIMRDKNDRLQKKLEICSIYTSVVNEALAKTEQVLDEILRLVDAVGTSEEAIKTLLAIRSLVQERGDPISQALHRERVPDETAGESGNGSSNQTDEGQS